ncbi:RNA12 protein-domain-containing protein [Syncephalastrum racemosum]|uniref:Mitochondrial escape protein 2 n=1 Tax=Syncephalastrum racemosum TaxID=13706 RepID=A0A1X2HDW3_SYNRA|nr:RNA12 protein-domain-containing protein [Syncephalastrum racemosum]
MLSRVCMTARPTRISPRFGSGNLHRLRWSRQFYTRHVKDEVTSELGKEPVMSIITPFATQEQTAMLYLDNIFPLRMNTFDIRQLFFRNTRACLESRAHKAIPSQELAEGFHIKRMESRIKDGGAIIEFGFNSTAEQKSRIAKQIVQKIERHLEDHKTVASFNFQPVRAFLVKGEPFLEDIVSRFPTPKLRIEFINGEPVSVEKLYKHLRPYGRIYDIALYPNPHVSKDPARYAIVQFTRIRSATSARNCLHGHIIHGTRLNLLYERQLRSNVVREWLANHPKITVPVFAALVAGITYAVFDPIRVFCMTSKVTQRFNPEEYALYRWLRRETWARLMSTERSLASHQSIWEDDSEDIDKVNTWLRETPETFVIVTGPKGSGKSALVHEAVKDRRNKIIINCEELANSRSMTDVTTALAKQLGYFPVFTWVSSMSNLLETVVTATTGQKAGLSSSPDTQIKRILETAAVALRDVTPKERSKERHEDTSHLSIIETVKKWFVRDDGEEPSPEDVRGEIPIVVFDNFMYKETAFNSQLWTEMAEFAALLVENEVAHVVFVSSNVSVNKVLSRALPGKSFETIALSDAPPEISLSFVARQLGEDAVKSEGMHGIVSALGGRLTELELLVQKMKMGMDAETAFDDIVNRNVVEIRKYGFNEACEEDDHSLPWSPIQFWEIVKGLAERKSMNYDDLRWNVFFNGDDKPLRDMERAELITILHKEGRPNAIRPGKPVFYTVFDRLVTDDVFAASMEIESNTYLKKSAEQSIAKLEETILSLSHIYNGKPPREINTRITYLLGKVSSTQKLIESYETRITEAKQVVKNAWKDNSSE